MPRSTRPLGSQPVAVIRCSGLMRAPPACGPLPWRIGMESEKVLPWRTSPAAHRRGDVVQRALLVVGAPLAPGGQGAQQGLELGHAPAALRTAGGSAAAPS